MLKKWVVIVVGCIWASLAMSPAAIAAELTVGTIERAPFASKKDNTWTGYTVEVVEEVAKRQGSTVLWQENTVFSDMITSVADNKVQLAAANISITSEREKTLDFTAPIYDSGHQIFTPKGQGQVSTLSIMWKSGILQFVGLAFFILIVVAHLVWFFERDHRGQDYFRDDYKGGIWDAFWWAFIIVTIGGFENERPERPIGRVLAVFWILASIFFISTFTAKITTSLTVAKLQSSIESYQDLQGLKVGAATGTTTAKFLDSANISFVPYADFTQVLAAVEAGQLEAGVGDAPVVRYYHRTDPNSNISLAADVFGHDQLAIAFPEDSELFEAFNQTLITLREDGTLATIEAKYFGVR